MQDGRILAIMRQYTDVDDGGDLVIIDGTHYVENTQPLLANPTLTGPAQTAATTNDVLTMPGPSPGGRFNSAYPLQDGTGRILVSWSAVPAARHHADAAGDRAVHLARRSPPPTRRWRCRSTACGCSIPTQNTLQPIMPPVEGVMVTDVAVAQPRPLPNIILDQVPVSLNQNWVNAGVGVIDIRSVYDFDGVDTAKPNIATLADPGADSGRHASGALHPPGEGGVHPRPDAGESLRRGLRRQQLT